VDSPGAPFGLIIPWIAGERLSLALAEESSRHAEPRAALSSYVPVMPSLQLKATYVVKQKEAGSQFPPLSSGGDGGESDYSIGRVWVAFPCAGYLGHPFTK
jgi:hypothetical protein